MDKNYGCYTEACYCSKCKWFENPYSPLPAPPICPKCGAEFPYYKYTIGRYAFKKVGWWIFKTESTDGFYPKEEG